MNLSLKSKWKIKQNSSNYNIIKFSAEPRKSQKWNIRLRQNQPKQSVIYINDYNIPDTDDCYIELKKEHNLSDVQKATWIKNKNTTGCTKNMATRFS